ncbi:probable sugar phosphate/phosphate translocator At1g06470 [Zingiber officinale]|uniref:probable sugar phosphate/phosphate translocator At1g06470 n=1 Tax=Zingiber officinale TaxID=94328 RepID=UPI001C4B89BE|nr:probable sugar phosphate/phosphate translocator At1g06470 [Zingiber officinale]
MMELSNGLGDEETVEATEAAAAHTEDKVGEVGKEKEKDRKLSLRREPSFSRWCNEDGILRQSAVDDDGSPRTNSAAEESEEFELPLLHQRMPDEVGSQAEDQRRIHEFRQRSMFLGIVNGDTEKYVPLDIENDVHVSDSMTKIVSLEQSRNSAISFAILLKTLFYILVWYTLSTCLTVYNKTLLGDNLGKFPAPLLMNTIHFSLQAIFSNVIVYIQSRNSESSNNIMTWKDYFARVIPTAIGTALDVNLSNESLVYITVTFATMCKSASPIFLLMFAFAFRLEKPSLKLVGIMLIISVGVLLTVTKETKFEFWGFIFVMLSAVMAGFRWCMTQILLQEEAYGLKNPITLMSYVTPVMAIITVVLSLFLDPWDTFKGNNYFDSSKHIIRSCLLMLLGGALAFCMVLMEYILVSATSAVTVTVAGIVKEAVTILVAVFYFHDQFTWLKGVGLLTIMVGVSLFNCFKYYKLKKEGTNRLTERDAKYVILDDTELQDDELEFPSV